MIEKEYLYLEYNKRGNPISVVPGCSAGQFTLKQHNEQGLPFAVVPLVTLEQKDAQLKRVMVAASAPEMLDVLIEAKKELEAIDWSALELHLDDGFLPRSESEGFVNVQLLLAKIDEAVGKLENVIL